MRTIWMLGLLHTLDVWLAVHAPVASCVYTNVALNAHVAFDLCHHLNPTYVCAGLGSCHAVSWCVCCAGTDRK